jgi:hypothetical protein
MGKTVTVTVEIDCDCGEEPGVLQTGFGDEERWSDGDVIHTDDPEHFAPVGHDAGRPHVEGDPDDEAEE